MLSHLMTSSLRCNLLQHSAHAAAVLSLLMSSPKMQSSSSASSDECGAMCGEAEAARWSCNVTLCQLGDCDKQAPAMRR